MVFFTATKVSYAQQVALSKAMQDVIENSDDISAGLHTNNAEWPLVQASLYRARLGQRFGCLLPQLHKPPSCDLTPMVFAQLWSTRSADRPAG